VSYDNYVVFINKNGVVELEFRNRVCYLLDLLTFVDFGVGFVGFDVRNRYIVDS
jgi:hypothetical protein